MLRHIVMVTFKPGTTEQQRADYQAAVEQMSRTSPEVQAMTCGTNVGSGPNHHDFAVVMDFDNMTAFRTYVSGPAHAAYVESVHEMIDSLSAIQHEL